ncbi:MAG: chromosomal replication initiator protein DnaA [Flavobacteriaceae bacterium]|nr:chromosomal replication initiator protein DnaA [Flavobacteriaceae bacterium]
MIATAENVWNECLSFIKDNVNNQAYKTWFSPIVPLKISGDVLTIQVPSKFFYEWLEEHYVKLLKVALVKQLGSKAKLLYDVRIDNSHSSKINNITIPSSGRSFTKGVKVNNYEGSKEFKNPFVVPGIQKIKVESQLNKNYNFDNFIEGECNRLVRSAGLAVSSRPGGTSFNPLLIYGGVGLGKTHVAHAIGLEIKEKHPEKTVLYISSEKFTQQFIDSIKSNSRNDFIHFYQMIDVLIVDDVQFLSGKTATQDVFFHIFNHLHQNGKQVILTSDKAPVDMQDIEHRLLSRFKWGLSAELLTPNFETKVSILNSKIQNDGVVMPEEVVNYLAKNVNSNIRELEGTLISMIAQSSFNRIEYSLELASSVVNKFVKNEKKEMSIDRIKEVVSEYFDLDVQVLQSKTRKRHVVQARQMAMFFSKRLTPSSLANIGAQIGKRDHATVLHACKTINNLSETDKKFKQYITDISNKLNC